MGSASLGRVPDEAIRRSQERTFSEKGIDDVVDEDAPTIST